MTYSYLLSKSVDKAYAKSEEIFIKYSDKLALQLSLYLIKEYTRTTKLVNIKKRTQDYDGCNSVGSDNTFVSCKLVKDDWPYNSFHTKKCYCKA